MITKYVTSAGGGAHDGSSVANAYTLAEMVTYVNGLGTLSDYHTFRLCGNFTSVTASIALTKAASYTTRMFFEGYDSGGTVPTVITMSANAAIKLWDLTGGATWYSFRRIYAINISTATYGWDAGTGQQFNWVDCKASLFPHPFSSTASGNATYIRCAATDSTGTGATHGFDVAQSARLIDCYAYNNTGAGFGDGQQYGCISHRNAGDGFVSFFADKCLSIDNGGHAFQGIGTGAMHIRNMCVAIERGAAAKTMYELNSASSRQQTLIRCASYVSGSNVRNANGVTIDIDPVVLTGNPFSLAWPGLNYKIQHVAGASQLLNLAGWNHNEFDGLKTYTDILAAQSLRYIKSV